MVYVSKLINQTGAPSTRYIRPHMLKKLKQNILHIANTESSAYICQITSRFILYKKFFPLYYEEVYKTYETIKNKSQTIKKNVYYEYTTIYTNTNHTII